MKVLITGGAGFIGSHTADLLLLKGHKVRILDKLKSPVHPRPVKPAYISDEVEFIHGNVCDREMMKKALSGIEIVFHLAAYQDYLTDFSNFALVNDFGTALLYELIINEQLPVKKVILASSQGVYGEGKYRCPDHDIQYPLPRPLDQLTKREWNIKCSICQQNMEPLLTDESQVNPHNQYAISKYCQELYALNLGKRYGIPTVAMRYSITQGPRQSFFNAYSGILRIFSLRLLSNHAPIAYEDAQQLRDYAFVGDTAKANLLVMERNDADYNVFNVGGNRAVTVLEYAKLLISLTGKNIEPEIPGEFRWGDTRHIISDSSKLRNLGWQANTPLEQIAREYLNWVQDQPNVSDYYTEAAKMMKQIGVIRSSE